MRQSTQVQERQERWFFVGAHQDVRVLPEVVMEGRRACLVGTNDEEIRQVRGRSLWMASRSHCLAPNPGGPVGGSVPSWAGYHPCRGPGKPRSTSRWLRSGKLIQMLERSDHNRDERRELVRYLADVDRRMRHGAPAASRPHVHELRFLAFIDPKSRRAAENAPLAEVDADPWQPVCTAKPRFAGHYQPHLPAEQLGLYDLRDAAVRERQAELARAHGVDGFVYLHYWFTGRRVLEQAFDEMISSRRPDFPFCLCWVNQDWTLATDSAVPRIQLEQTYGEDDDLAHIRWLATTFADPRYIRVNGKPLLLIHRACHLPNARYTTDLWRAEAQRLGIGDLYLVRVEAFPQDRADPGPLGFDASVESQPDLWVRSPQLLTSPAEQVDARSILSRYPAAGGVFSYLAATELALNAPNPSYNRYR
ncbi:MAG: hypothetical protein E6J45_07950, partial [Chloroflexi bacterium]